jgi:type I restriction enzyme S subunit
VDKLTQSLLAKAFRGELVPQDPNDEPASALLARIRSCASGGAKRRRRKATA